MTLNLPRLLSVLLLGATIAAAPAAQAGPRITVFAAASLKNALDDVAAAFEQGQDFEVSLSYAGSSGLARQIQLGAPAQIFISANTTWMDALEVLGLLVPGSRVDLLGNQLVLIAGSEADIDLKIAPGMDLAGALQGGRLATALVDAVPAGIYGRAALVSLGVWDQVQDRTVQTDNVRAALRLVALQEAPLGIVYATDAAAEPRVRVVGVFPRDLYPPITYPAALTGPQDSAAARAFFRFLAGPEARVIFRRHGFEALQGGSS